MMHDYMLRVFSFWILVSLLCISPAYGKRLPSQVRIDIDVDGGRPHKVVNILEKKLPLDLESLILKGMIERAEKRRDADMLFKRGSSPEPQVSLKLEDGSNDIMLETTVQVIPSISIFSGYIRELGRLSIQLADSKENLLIFAPSDETIAGLVVKPWEYPNDIEEMEKKGESPDKINAAINDNIYRFVLSHVVSKLDFQTLKDGSEVLLKSDFYPHESTGGDILLKKEGMDYLVASARDGDFVKVTHVDTAANGIVMVIDTCLSYEV